jgi:hypothetical protein
MQFWRALWRQWTLYVDLGAERQALDRMVQEELSHIPRAQDL